MTCLMYINQHLLFKSGSSFKSLFKSILKSIFIFVSEVIIQYFFLRDSISIKTNNNNKQHTLHARTLPALPSLSRQPPQLHYTRQHVTHASMLPTQACHTHHTHQHTTYISTLPTLARIAHHFLNSTKTTHSIERVISECFLHEFVTPFPLFIESYLVFK